MKVGGFISRLSWCPDCTVPGGRQRVPQGDAQGGDGGGAAPGPRARAQPDPAAAVTSPGAQRRPRRAAQGDAETGQGRAVRRAQGDRTLAKGLLSCLAGFRRSGRAFWVKDRPEMLTRRWRTGSAVCVLASYFSCARRREMKELCWSCMFAARSCPVSTPLATRSGRELRSVLPKCAGPGSCVLDCLPIDHAASLLLTDSRPVSVCCRTS